MSSYGKSEGAYVYDYATTRPNAEQSYAAFAQHSYASQYPDIQAQDTHGMPAAGQMPFLLASAYEPRDLMYQAPAAPLIDPRSRQPPEITSYSPSKGLHGAKLYVSARTSYDLTAQRRLFFFVQFGSKRCDAMLTKADRRAAYYHYTFATDIPPFDSVGWPDSQQVPLLLDMQDESGNSLGVVEVGDFTYADVSSFQGYSSPQDVSRKRKAEATEYVRSPAKRASSQQLYRKAQDASSMYPSMQSVISPASPYAHHAAPSGVYGLPVGYDAPQQQLHTFPHRTAQKLSYPYGSSPTTSQSYVKVQSPLLTGYNPYPGASQPDRSPVASTISAVQRSRVVAPTASLANPPLIRTSTLQPSPTAPTPVVPGVQPFNPYAIYPNSKAVLKIEGDLESMSERWSQEEWDAKRRLVQFQRSQSGSTITTSFKAVSPEERTPNSICISCIWWEEKQECFVTSVDTIYLLESLVAVRFTVEEKNRIRRNLEGFRPLTVSKAKPDSEEFFKIIMGFPNPKPRNIEKDVKVFPWKILSHALKKIISKYSASYSSTAGALLPPVSSGYSGGGLPESRLEQQPATSPRSASSSVPSSTHRSSMTSAILSPSMPTSAGLDESAGPPGLRGPAPQQGMGQWQAQQPQSTSMYSAGLSVAGRGSWDMAAYIDASSATAASATTQSLHYAGGDGATEQQRRQQKQQQQQQQQPSPHAAVYQQYGQRTSRG